MRDAPASAAPVLLDESVYSIHLSNDHAAAQLIERLRWGRALGWVGLSGGARRAILRDPSGARVGSGQLSIREVARRTGLHRDTIGRALAAERPPYYRPRPKMPSKLDPHHEQIAHLSREVPGINNTASAS
jgi:hypothetical protein